eukprot:366557-Chlamydomonas_euryale.AAC.2
MHADARARTLKHALARRHARSVKSGGPDPVSNAGLDLIMRQAKEAGVPRDIIDRNVKRATDGKQRTPMSRPRYNSAALPGYLSLTDSEPAQSRDPRNPSELHGHAP